MSKKPQHKQVIKDPSQLASNPTVAAMVNSDAAKQDEIARAEEFAARHREKREAIIERARQSSEAFMKKLEAAAETLTKAIDVYVENLSFAADLEKALGDARPKTDKEFEDARREDDEESPTRMYAEAIGMVRGLENRFPDIQKFAAERTQAAKKLEEERVRAEKKIEHTNSLIEALERDVAKPEDPSQVSRVEEIARSGRSPYDRLVERLEAAKNIGVVDEVNEKPDKGRWIEAGPKKKPRYFVGHRFDLSRELDQKLFELVEPLFAALYKHKEACHRVSVEYKDVRKAKKVERTVNLRELEAARKARIAELETEASGVEVFLKGDGNVVAGWVPGWEITDRETRQRRSTRQFLEVERGEDGAFVVADNSSFAFKHLIGKRIAKTDPAAKVILKALHTMEDALKGGGRRSNPAADSERIARGLPAGTDGVETVADTDATATAEEAGEAQ